MKRILLIILILSMLCSQAFAADEYIIEAMDVQKDVLLDLVFGEEASLAEQVKGREDMFFEIPNDSINRYIGYQIWKLAPYQAQINAYIDRGERDLYFTYENFEPSGITKDNYSREEAINKAMKIADKLGIKESKLWHALAYGKLEFCTACYSILIGQTIENAPMYWAASYFKTDKNGNSDWNMQSNAVRIELSSEGLLGIQGSLSKTIAQNKNLQIIDEEKAKEKFKEIGLQAENIEFCYLIQQENKKAVAKPCYRYQNYFISASTGHRLQ